MPHPPPPRLAETVLRALFPDEVDETRLGDLEEVYHHIGLRAGYVRARQWYWMQVVRAFLPSLSQRFAWTFVMLRNYLHTAFRHLRRHTIYTVINVFGLSVALAVAVLAYLFIHSE
ncbi:MAG TPA: permease prefix domain 2-containing transporter, partial [Rhodothermales bacterium]|nr:permease prefix domain 2-containing transporter [Rhodothermales bacterium]